MAVGFQQSGIFGRRPIPQMNDNPAAMPAGQMPIGVAQISQPKKPGFFGQGGVGRMIAGTIGDFLMQNAGMQPVYGPSVLQQRDAAERARMAQAQRMQKREDMMWEWQNKPKDNNPYRWKSNDGSLMEIGPDGQPRQVYKDPNKRLEYRQGPDGRFYPIDTADAPLPTFTEDDWNNAGGSVGNGAGGFR